MKKKVDIGLKTCYYLIMEDQMNRDIMKTLGFKEEVELVDDNKY